jgi:hypothetical protein
MFRWVGRGALWYWSAICGSLALSWLCRGDQSQKLSLTPRRWSVWVYSLNTNPWKSKSMEQNPLKTSQEIPHLLWNLKIRYRVRRTCHGSLSWSRCIKPTPSHPISLRFILILSSYLRQSLPSGLFPSDSSTKMLYAFLVSPMRFDLITLIIFGETYRHL